MVRFEIMDERGGPVGLADIVFLVDRKDPDQGMPVVWTGAEMGEEVPEEDSEAMEVSTMGS
jgi:hypothetical protein